jgi:hypothetical protein
MTIRGNLPTKDEIRRRYTKGGITDRVGWIRAFYQGMKGIS